MSSSYYSSGGYAPPPPMDPTMTLPPSFNPMFMPHNFLLPAFGSSPPPKTAQTTTVFVGNINEKCSNEFMERILKECGTVDSWKRIQGTQGKPQAFGFCEFVQPDGTLRALRLLGKIRLFDKELIVKAEDKVLDELRTWSANKRKEDGKPALALKGDELPADDEDLKKDKEVLERILAWVKEDYPNITIAASAKAETSTSVGDERRRDEKERKSDRNHRDRDHKRKRRSSRSPSHDKSRSRRRRSRSSSAATYSSGDSEEEDKKEEKRELKKKLREKEKLYNTRLSKWEEREDKMKRYYKKYERRKEEDFGSRKREGERLRYFLEKYQDEREDPKWYRGSELARRKKQFARQQHEDDKDRELEMREIEELKALEAKAREESAAAAAAAAEAAAAVAMDTSAAQEAPPAEMTTEVKMETNKWTTSGISNGSPEASTSSSSAPVQAQAVVATPSPRVAAATSSTPSSSAAAPAVQRESSLSSRLQHVFGVDDEEEVDHMKTRKQLKPFEIDAKERLHMTEQERRILTREIVSKIPTKRDEVFNYKLDWSKLDDAMMKAKIVPWVGKKLATFIGEEDASLCDFVCQKVAQHKTPGDILLDIKIILDDDAELFVMKLWRLLIFEIEAKKIGLPTDR